MPVSYCTLYWADDGSSAFKICPVLHLLVECAIYVRLITAKLILYCCRLVAQKIDWQVLAQWRCEWRSPMNICTCAGVIATSPDSGSDQWSVMRGPWSFDRCVARIRSVAPGSGVNDRYSMNVNGNFTRCLSWQGVDFSMHLRCAVWPAATLLCKCLLVTSSCSLDEFQTLQPRSR
jgi:hypothetical protein